MNTFMFAGHDTVSSGKNDGLAFMFFILRYKVTKCVCVCVCVCVRERERERESRIIKDFYTLRKEKDSIKKIVFYK